MANIFGFLSGAGKGAGGCGSPGSPPGLVPPRGEGAQGSGFSPPGLVPPRGEGADGSGFGAEAPPFKAPPAKSQQQHPQPQPDAGEPKSKSAPPSSGGAPGAARPQAKAPNGTFGGGAVGAKAAAHSWEAPNGTFGGGAVGTKAAAHSWEAMQPPAKKAKAVGGPPYELVPKLPPTTPAGVAGAPGASFGAPIASFGALPKGGKGPVLVPSKQQQPETVRPPVKMAATAAAAAGGGGGGQFGAAGNGSADLLAPQQSAGPKLIPVKSVPATADFFQTKAAPVRPPPPPPQPQEPSFEQILAENQRILDEQQRRLQEFQAQQEAEERRKAEEERKRREDELRKQAEEIQRQQLELKRLEEQNRREEAENTAKQLQLELNELVLASEKELNEATQAAEPILNETHRKGMKDDDIIKVAEDFESGKNRTQLSLKASSSFMTGKHKLLVGVLEETRKAATEIIQRVGKIERGLALLAGKISSLKLAAQQRRDAEARKEAALKEAKRQEEVFKRFDSNSDGKLSSEDIVLLCKEEYSFELSDARLDHISKADCFKSTNGVPFAKFAQLRTLIGIARGEVIAKQRREEAERRRKLALAQVAQVDKDAAEATQGILGIETEVVKAEKQAAPMAAIQHSKIFQPAAVEVAVEQIDIAVEAARDFVAAVQEQLQSLGGGEKGQVSLEPEAQNQAKKQAQQISFRLKGFEARLARCEGIAKTARQKVELHNRKAALLREADLALQ